jgi:fibronectin-binding autotransporter adhesin
MKVSPQAMITIPGRLKISLASLAAVALGAPLLHSQTGTPLYFDPNGTTQTGSFSGTWDAATTADWSVSPAGQGTPQVYANTGTDARFSATSGTNTTVGVTMGSAVNALGLYFDNGTTTITSGSNAITVGVDGITVASGASGSVGNVSGAAGIITTVSETWTNNGSVAFVDGGGSIGGDSTLNTGLILANGSFTLGNTGQNNNIAGSGSITVDSGATFTVGGSGGALGGHNVYLDGGTIGSVAAKCVSNISAFLEANSSSSVSGSSTTPMASLALDGNYTLTANAGSYMVVNVIKNGTSGTNLTIAGPSTGTTLGQVALNGTSTFTGTTVTLGTLSALSFGAGSTGGDINNGAGAGFTGGTISNSGVVAFNHSGAYTFNGHITGTGGVTNVGGTNTLADGTDDYTGVTTASGGTLSATTLSNGLSVSSIGASSNAAANLVLETGGTFQYSGSGGSTDRLFTLYSNTGAGMTLDASGTGAINFTNTGSLTVAGGKGFTFGLTGSSTANNTLAPKIVNYNGSNITSVSKSGAGTWILTNANTYTGATTISAGALLANNTTGSGTGSGAVSVTGGTLGGAGFLTVASATIATGASLAPGASIGATTGAFTLSTTSGVTINGTLAIALNGATGTSLTYATGGALTLGNASILSITGTTGAGENVAGDYDIANYSGTLGGNGTFATTTIPNGYTLVYNGTNFANSGGFDIEIDPVPEPTTWAGVLIGAGLVAFNVRRRVNRSALTAVTVS